MLTVATWNLENLFRPGRRRRRRAPSYARKLDALAAMIERIAPDVLAVQEVGDPDALGDLLALWRGTGTASCPRMPTDAASASGSSRAIR